MHISDNNGIKDHLKIGDGNIDWKRFAQLIKKVSIEGPFVFEIFDVSARESMEKFMEFF